MRTPAIGPIPSRAKFGGAALARKPVSNACYFGRTHTHVVPLSSCELKPCFAVLAMSHAFVYFSASYTLPLITKGYKPLHIQIVRIHCLCKPQMWRVKWTGLDRLFLNYSCGHLLTCLQTPRHLANYIASCYETCACNCFFFFFNNFFKIQCTRLARGWLTSRPRFQILMYLYKCTSLGGDLIDCVILNNNCN